MLVVMLLVLLAMAHNVRTREPSDSLTSEVTPQSVADPVVFREFANLCTSSPSIAPALFH